VRFGDQDFTLPGAVHELEARLIARALEEPGGSVTKAARLLGLTHQTLGSILHTRHKQLTGKRKPPQKRLKSIIKKPNEQAASQLQSLPHNSTLRWPREAKPTPASSLSQHLSGVSPGMMVAAGGWCVSDQGVGWGAEADG
jgi:transposase-like protein